MKFLELFDVPTRSKTNSETVLYLKIRAELSGRKVNRRRKNNFSKIPRSNTSTFFASFGTWEIKIQFAYFNGTIRVRIRRVEFSKIPTLSEEPMCTISNFYAQNGLVGTWWASGVSVRTYFFIIIYSVLTHLRSLFCFLINLPWVRSEQDKAELYSRYLERVF